MLLMTFIHLLFPYVTTSIGCNKTVLVCINRTAISAPTNFTHVQHFGPYQSLNPEDMPVCSMRMFFVESIFPASRFSFLWLLDFDIGHMP